MPQKAQHIMYSLFKSAQDVTPKRVEVTWEEFADGLAEYKSKPCTLATCRRGKCEYKPGRAWSPAVWPAGKTRQKSTVESVHALVIDLDHLTDEALEDAVGRLEPYDYVLHASHSDQVGDRCVRVVLRLSRPVTGKDWPRFWRAAVDQLGIKVDEQCKDASRLYFLPSRPDDAEENRADGYGYDYTTNEGAPLDVDEILALAPPDEPHVASSVVIPAFKGAPSEEKYRVAVEALGKAWPASGRHRAQLALAGALTRAGWPVPLVAQFCFDVAEVQEPGNGDLEKREKMARSSHDKLAMGEAIIGWPTLAELVSQEAVDAAMAALGIGPVDDPEFAAHMTKLTTPTRKAVKTALQGARDRLRRSTNGDLRYAGELLALALAGKPLVDPDEDGEQALKDAALAMARAAPTGTPPKYIHDLLLPSAEDLRNDLPAVVAAAVDQVAEETQRSKQTIEELPEPANDEELREQLERNERGNISSCGANVERVLRFSSDLRDNLRFNDLKKRLEIKGGRFANETPETLSQGVANWLGAKWKVSASDQETYRQIKRVAQIFRCYNPVAEHLDSLEEWDRVPCLDTWLITYFGADDTPFVRMVGPRQIIACVACAMHPGSKIDTVLVLEGFQGTKKSAALKILGGPWYSGTSHDINSKDALMQSTSCWVLELQEMSAVNDADPEHSKGFLASEQMNFRPPYAREFQDFPRRCVFFGTTNKDRYLKDPTGDRRYWPVYVTRCEEDALERDRDQLLAEALFRYRSAKLNPHLAAPKIPGERWWLVGDEEKIAEKETRQRVVFGAMAAKIHEALERDRKQAGARGGALKYYTPEEIATDVLQLSILEAEKSHAQILVAMRAAGLEILPRRVSKTNRKHLWAYVPSDERPGLEDGSVAAAPASTAAASTAAAAAAAAASTAAAAASTAAATSTAAVPASRPSLLTRLSTATTAVASTAAAPDAAASTAAVPAPRPSLFTRLSVAPASTAAAPDAAVSAAAAPDAAASTAAAPAPRPSLFTRRSLPVGQIAEGST